MPRLLLMLVAGALLALAATSAAAAATRGLSIGFFDPILSSADATQRAPWLARAVDSGADVVRLQIPWVAPNTPARPAGFDARNPADPAYDFAAADAAIVDATSHNLRVLLSFSGAPRWAEGARRRAGA